MKPNCEMVEYASTFFTSRCVKAIVAAKRAVKVPIIIIGVKVTNSPCGTVPPKIGNMRMTMYTPALTMAAAWIMAETGVGPSIASGSQVCSGNCALLPMVPMNNNM